MGTSRRTTGTFRRAGVTLIELLVVISIIVVLVGLTFTLFSAGERAADRIEAQVASVNHQARKKHPPNRFVAKTLPNQYLVTFNRTVTDPQAEATRLGQAVPANIVNVYTTAIKGCSVRIQPTDLAALQADPAVASVSPAYYRYACQAVFPTGVSRIQYVHAPRTPPFQLFFPGTGSGGTTIGNGGPRNLGPGFNIGGAAVTPPKAVAIMDTGIDGTHPDLNVVLSKSFVNGVPNGDDQFGHGTHCAGIVGAKGVGVTGVFPGVPLWSLRVFDNANPPGAADPDVIAALDFLAQNVSQVSVCNMSLGGKGIDQALNNAVTNCVNLGVVMCVAAGNDAADTSNYCPATAVGAICVGALCDTDGLPGGKGPAASAGEGSDPDDTFASFSNWGPVVAVLGPGADILSTIPVAQGSYGLKSGTSMATPHVAGLSALVLGTYSATPNANGAGVRNLIGGGVSSQLVINNPAQVLGFLLQDSVEQFPGLQANKDPRTSYPLVTARP
jgi:prepilin-type N-terminal cleavage/methylation domain-containing protein